MKLFSVTVVAAMLLAGVAQAKGKDSRQTCGALGKMYMTAAALRDQGRDRDVIFGQLRVMAMKVEGYFIDDDQVFDIANEVYYSAAFSDKGGESLRKEIEQQCLDGQLVDVFVKRE